mmetsp:Transcript_6796/g.11437  ORF Transcript_6796/g.11437 Transcript_6796/m.11437 type:complete len:146 (+) Transcript_6796:424-861(+)
MHGPRMLGRYDTVTDTFKGEIAVDVPKVPSADPLSKASSVPVKVEKEIDIPLTATAPAPPALTPATPPPTEAPAATPAAPADTPVATSQKKSQQSFIQMKNLIIPSSYAEKRFLEIESDINMTEVPVDVETIQTESDPNCNSLKC